MKKYIFVLLLFIVKSAYAQLEIDKNTYQPSFTYHGEKVITPASEGLWGVSTTWKNNWMANWKYANPDRIEKSGDWSIVSGKMEFPEGDLLLRDAYRIIKDGLIQCHRRFEWKGTDTLENVNLSVRYRVKGKQMQTLMPGIIYYGNKNGAKVNPDAIPVYNGTPGEFAIFEDHRFSMPFTMLENADKNFAATIHTIPSPVRGALLNDQWWSMGVEAGEGYTDLVLYTGPIGYNKRHGVAKALQPKPMEYNKTFLNLEPGRIIEKEFYIELSGISEQGTGFQQPIYTSLDLHKPYYADRFPDFRTIISEKYRYAKSRWIEFDKDAVGFNMYDEKLRKDLVMGWCGQADSPGYFLQILDEDLGDEQIHSYVQRSLDYLSTYPINDKTGMFSVGFDGKKFHGGDPVSCGQAMYDIAKAIQAARKTGEYDCSKWESFLKKACKAQSKRILDSEWNPESTAEAFLIAPLIIASELFDNSTFKEAAVKAGNLYAKRHLTMDGCYWGGTLDATCEDKEGAWAAFQGFLTLYEQLNKPEYLIWAKHAMDVCLSYVVIWDIPLPAGRLSDHNFKSTGWTVVSPQNQHLDVYGVMFAPEVYKMGSILRDNRLKQLARVMYRSCFQLTDMYGSQGEQLLQTNYAQRGDRSNVYRLRGGYSETWTVFWITAHFLNAAAKFKEMNVIP